MTETTFYSSIFGIDDVYNSLNGADSTDWEFSRSTVGGYGPGNTLSCSKFSSKYYINEIFLEFDTSIIGSGQTVSSAILYMAHNYRDPTSFNVEARITDWGETFTMDDFIPGGNLGDTTLLAHIANESLYSIDTYYAFIDDAMAANINCTGKTRMVLFIDKIRLDTPPTEGNRVWFYPNTDETYKPKLVVTYAATEEDEEEEKPGGSSIRRILPERKFPLYPSFRSYPIYIG